MYVKLIYLKLSNLGSCSKKRRLNKQRKYNAKKRQIDNEKKINPAFYFFGGIENFDSTKNIAEFYCGKCSSKYHA